MLLGEPPLNLLRDLKPLWKKRVVTMDLTGYKDLHYSLPKKTDLKSSDWISQTAPNVL